MTKLSAIYCSEVFFLSFVLRRVDVPNVRSTFKDLFDVVVPQLEHSSDEALILELFREPFTRSSYGAPLLLHPSPSPPPTELFLEPSEPSVLSAKVSEK